MMADNVPYLHPIIRHLRGEVLMNDHQINDDLESQWEKDDYSQFLRDHSLLIS